MCACAKQASKGIHRIDVRHRSILDQAIDIAVEQNCAGIGGIATHFATDPGAEGELHATLVISAAKEPEGVYLVELMGRQASDVWGLAQRRG